MWPADSSSNTGHGHSPSSETIATQLQSAPVQPSTPTGYMALHTDPPTLPSQYALSTSRLPSHAADDMHNGDSRGKDDDLELFYYRFVRTVCLMSLLSSHPRIVGSPGFYRCCVSPFSRFPGAVSLIEFSSARVSTVSLSNFSGVRHQQRRLFQMFGMNWQHLRRLKICLTSTACHYLKFTGRYWNCSSRRLGGMAIHSLTCLRLLTMR